MATHIPARKRLAAAFVALGLVITGCGDPEVADTADSGSTTTTMEPTTTRPDMMTSDATAESAPPAQGNTTTTIAEGISINVEDGEPVGGAAIISVDQGSTVSIVVNSDTEQIVHVHGYDLFYDVGPGSPAEIILTADVPGVFEIELEGSHTLIAELEVS